MQCQRIYTLPMPNLIESTLLSLEQAKKKKSNRTPAMHGQVNWLSSMTAKHLSPTNTHNNVHNHDSGRRQQITRRLFLARVSLLFCSCACNHVQLRSQFVATADKRKNVEKKGKCAPLHPLDSIGIARDNKRPTPSNDIDKRYSRCRGAPLRRRSH